eukprot:1188439-Prorocentrum_minimum.AAC.2
MPDPLMHFTRPAAGGSLPLDKKKHLQPLLSRLIALSRLLSLGGASRTPSWTPCLGPPRIQRRALAMTCPFRKIPPSTLAEPPTG